MNLPSSIYCFRCQEPVKPLKCIVIYRCPECGEPIAGYDEGEKDERERDEREKAHETDKSDQVPSPFELVVA